MSRPLTRLQADQVVPADAAEGALREQRAAVGVDQVLVELARRVAEELDDHRREDRDQDQEDQKTPPAMATLSRLSRVQAIWPSDRPSILPSPRPGRPRDRRLASRGPWCSGRSPSRSRRTRKIDRPGGRSPHIIHAGPAVKQPRWPLPNRDRAPGTIPRGTRPGPPRPAHGVVGASVKAAAISARWVCSTTQVAAPTSRPAVPARAKTAGRPSHAPISPPPSVPRGMPPRSPSGRHPGPVRTGRRGSGPGART